MKRFILLVGLVVGSVTFSFAQDFPQHLLVKSESRMLQKLAVEIDMGDYKRYPELKTLEKAWEKELRQLKSHVAMVAFFEDMGYVMKYYNIVQNHVDSKQETMDNIHYFWFTYEGVPVPKTEDMEASAEEPEG
ncbi:MAG TPA: hypothetical protein DCE41_10115 [Cytophagales bacterium]|nr:hypothetical protein [Cytophagales bacterium]HAA22096.1 hypothetical protein [Cytophagales bacterium]HAP60849.1 hypothetical protein [Cytophagales bacterium]